ERFTTRGRGRRADVADHVGQICQTVLVRVGDPVGPHQRVVRQPHDAAGKPGRTADEGLLLDDQRLEPAVECRPPGHHPPTDTPPPTATSRDEQVDGAVPRRGHRASEVGLEVNPRLAIGTSMVVLAFWIAGTSDSYGRPARKPSMTRSKFEISPSIRSDRRMY